MDVYLVRHAIAEPRDGERWPDDALRPLSTEGAELFRLAARGLKRLGIEVEAALASSNARAWQTAEILTEVADWPEALPCPELEPTSDPEAAFAVLAGRTESLLALVGHEPDLSELASLSITGDRDGAQLELKKGGVICLRFRGTPTPGGGLLRWSASPKILRQLGR